MPLKEKKSIIIDRGILEKSKITGVRESAKPGNLGMKVSFIFLEKEKRSKGNFAMQEWQVEEKRVNCVDRCSEGSRKSYAFVGKRRSKGAGGSFS